MNPNSAVFIPIVRKKYRRPFNIVKKVKWKKKQLVKRKSDKKETKNVNKVKAECHRFMAFKGCYIEHT